MDVRSSNTGLARARYGTKRIFTSDCHGDNIYWYTNRGVKAGQNALINNMSYLLISTGGCEIYYSFPIYIDLYAYICTYMNVVRVTIQILDEVRERSHISNHK